MATHVYDFIRAVKSRLYLPEGQTSITEDEIVGQLNEELCTSVFIQLSKLQSEYSTVRKYIPLQAVDGSNLYPLNMIPIPKRSYGNGIVEVKYINERGVIFNLPMADTADYESWVNYSSNKFPYSFVIVADGIQLLSVNNEPVKGSLEIFFTLEPLEVTYPPNTASFVALPVYNFLFDNATNRTSIQIQSITNNDVWNTYIVNDNQVTYKFFDIISKKSGQPIAVDLPFTRTSDTTLRSMPDVLTELQVKNLATYQHGGFPIANPFTPDFYLVPSGITDRIPILNVIEYWLVTLVAKKLMSVIGDTEAFQQLSKDVEDERKDLIAILGKRVQKESIKMTNNTILNSLKGW